MSTERVSPTAYFTGQVWVENGLSSEALSTLQGRAILRAFRPLDRALERAAGRTGLESYLLIRHYAIDALLERAISSGEISQVLEIACGLSARGMRFTRRHPELTYLEVDLPHMAERKLAALKKASLLGPKHRVVPIDALTDRGPLSLDEVVQRELSPSEGVAIVIEGLIAYFTEDMVRGLFRRIGLATAAMPRGMMLVDFTAADRSSEAPTVRAFKSALGVFARGAMHMHPLALAHEALPKAGFSRVSALTPREILEDSPSVPRKVKASLELSQVVHIVQAERAKSEVSITAA